MRAIIRLVCFCCCALSCHSLCADDDADKFFETKIRPVLVEHCQDCHSTDNAESDLAVDSLAGMLKGGSRGPAIVRGNSKNSLLIRAINHGEVLQMPPRDKLSSHAIADLTRWVNMGAPWPNSKPVAPSSEQKTSNNLRGVVTDEDRRFWSFQPVQRPKLPAVKNSQWCMNSIDHFVLSRLETSGLQPAPRASRRQLIRRLTYDLTGLAPTREDIAAFLNDSREDAVDRLIERLLASPRYGERWGRHWLDVARYADSNGLDENLAYANAFRYRDYVIRSFNNDKPFDQFVREQIAGDLLPANTGETTVEKHDRLTATAFLSLGPKMLAEDDPVKMQMDIIDEQLDTTSRAFMGLTLGCARCHDHKFDPIPTYDYYALAGIFKSTKTMENHKVVAVWHEYELPDHDYQHRLETHNTQLVRAKQAVLDFEKQAHARWQAELPVADYLHVATRIGATNGTVATGAWPVGDYITPEQANQTGHYRECEKYDRGDILIDTTNWGKGVGVILNPGFAEWDVELPRAGEYQLEFRYAAAESRWMKLSINGRLLRSDFAGEVTGGWYQDHQKWHIAGVFKLPAGQSTIRVQSDGVTPHLDKFLLVPVTKTVEQDVQSIEIPPAQLDADVLRNAITYARSERGRAALEQIGASKKSLSELRELVNRAQDSANKDAAEIAVREILTDTKGPLSTQNKTLSDADSAKLKALEKTRDDLVKAKPAPNRTMGVREGQPQDLPIHLRGSHLTIGAVAPRGFLQVLQSDSVDTDPIDQKSSGRMELARWLSSAAHPLTARVIVNRIWLWHFGTGLVATPDNFGRLGAQPSHPELLDFLASEFVANGWSIKELHRRILKSATWQQSTQFNSTAADIDPDNKLYWRMSRRRLSAEEVRDSIIQFGHGLEHKDGGQLLKAKNRAYVTGTGSKQSTYDFNCRSVYLPVLRSAVYQVLQTFDFADPSVLNGRRVTTTIAPQALFMMNGELVGKNMLALSKRLLDDASLTDNSRVERVFETLLGRQPTAEEVTTALKFVNSNKPSSKADTKSSAEQTVLAWRSLCRVLLSSNEFIYVE